MNISYATIKPFEPFGLPNVHNFMTAQRLIELFDEFFADVCEAFRFEIVDKLLKNTIKGIMTVRMHDAGAVDPYCLLITLVQDEGGVVVGFILHYVFKIHGDPRKYTGRARYSYR